MLKRYEGEVGESTVRLQIIYKSAHPRRPTLGIRPYSNIFIDAFENGPSQFEFGINFVNGRGPLKVKRTVIFRHGVFAVGFLAHLYI